MPRFRFALTAVVAAVAAAALLSSLATAAAPRKLTGTVGPGYTISLKQNGKLVKKLKAGKVTITVTDKAANHSFELEQESGGKIKKEITDVSFTGKKTVTLTLKKGKYKYYCKPHESVMFGTFTVS